LSLSRKVTRNDFGSVAYLSPERLETGEVDARADLWALGVVLYEMLRGTPPFQATDTRRLERLIMARRPPSSLTEQVPAGLAAIVGRLLDPRQAERYASAREILDDLERFKAGRQTQAEEQGWPARAYDEGATRRTVPPSPETTRTAPVTSGFVFPPKGTVGTGDADAERTRRTVPPPIPGVVRPAQAAPLPAPQAVVASQPAPPVKKAPSRFRRLFRAALLLMGLGLIANEISVSSDAERLANAVSAHSFDQLPQAWRDYDELANRSNLGWGMGELSASLINQTNMLADRIIANYRSPSPTVREAQWAAARDALSLALSRVGNRNHLRARLQYCEGHLHRINGEAQKGRGEDENSRAELNEAVVAFREASQDWQDWLDPYLGLFRTFIVGLEDVRLAADAMDRARERSYRPTSRDEALLGDGYRLEGNAIVRTARQLEGLPQEREHLNQAAEAYRLALAHYAGAGGVSTVPANIIRTQHALLQVEGSLGEGLTAEAVPTEPETQQ